MNIKNSIWCLFIFCSLGSAGQEIIIGDSTIVGKVKPNTSQIFENRDRTYFFLTKKPLRQGQTIATNITAHSNKGDINRIIAISITNKGQLATEWYFLNGILIFAFESFEYFTEIDAPTSWKNFKGFQAWESRYYFENKFVKYQRHKGRKNVKGYKEAIKVQEDGETVLNYVIENTKK